MYYDNYKNLGYFKPASHIVFLIPTEDELILNLINKESLKIENTESIYGIRRHPVLLTDEEIKSSISRKVINVCLFPFKLAGWPLMAFVDTFDHWKWSDDEAPRSFVTLHCLGVGFAFDIIVYFECLFRHPFIDKCFKPRIFPIGDGGSEHRFYGSEYWQEWWL